jgi:hypothetical protein
LHAQAPFTPTDNLRITACASKGQLSTEVGLPLMLSAPTTVALQNAASRESLILTVHLSTKYAKPQNRSQGDTRNISSLRPLAI